MRTRRPARPARSTRPVLLVAAAAAGALALSSCGLQERATEAVAERAVEAAAGAAAGEGVDVDLDTDGGSLQVTGEDGQSFSVGGAELPEDWPGDVPLPAEAEVVSASQFADGQGGTASTVQLVLPGDARQGYDALRDDVLAQGWASQAESDMSSADGLFVSSTLTKDERVLQLGLLGGAAEDTVLSVSVTAEGSS